jgi:hypothetical protein
MKPTRTNPSLALCLFLPLLGIAGCPSDPEPSPGMTGGAGGRGGQAGGGRGGGGSGGAPAIDAAAAGSGGSAGQTGDARSPDRGGRDAGGSDRTRPADAGGSRDGGGADLPAAAPGPLTAGWTNMPFTFAIHKPFDLDASERYRFDPATGVHTLFVLRSDSAHQPGNTTAPRTEIRLRNDYTSGNHQFEADVMVVAGTDGPSIMQVFGGQTNATAFMLKASAAAGGTVRRYDNEVLKTNVYDKWFHLNVIHEAKADGIGKVKVYIDNQHVGTFDDRNTATHYFKCGVYGPASARAETRFRNIRYWVKP